MTDDQTRAAGLMPFVIGLLAMVVVAGMMRRLLATSGVTTLGAGLGAGLVTGLGIGACLVTPWVAMTYAFALRKPALTLIDGVNCTVGCGIMGAVLTAF